MVTTAPSSAPSPPASSPASGRAARGRAGLRDRAARLAGLSRSTRVGRLVVAAGLALALVLLAGTLALVAALRTGSAADAVVEEATPLTRAAQDLYRSLSGADAAAAAAYLRGAGHPEAPALREQYRRDVAAAGVALAAASRVPRETTASPGDPAVVLSAGLPAYTGLVATATTAERQRLAVGAAYLREASTLMQEQLLPAARALYDQQDAALRDRQETADGDAWSVLALLAVVAALVAVLVLHRRIARTTRRRLTPGVLLGAVALAVLLVWGAVGLGAASWLTASGRAEGTDPLREAVASRSAVLQSRADDLLALVARGAGTRYDEQYVERSVEFLGYDGHLDRAREAADDPRVDADLDRARAAGLAGVVVHDRARSLDASGNYPLAVELTLSGGPDGGAAAVAATSSALDDAVATTAGVAARDASAASAATTLLALGAVVLTVLAVAGIVVGVRPRIEEYR